MTSIALDARRTAWTGRALLLSIAMLLVVAGSQLGMLMLAAIYLRHGRLEDMVSPEAVLGATAIVLSLLVTRIPAESKERYEADWTARLLMVFLVVASIGELLRPDLRIGNVTTFASIGAYYLIGSAIGHDVNRRAVSMPLITVLLSIYTCWYLAMLLFLVSGDLGFYGILPGTNSGRLEFRDGFAATELPIYVGFQLPVLLYVLLGTKGTTRRFWAASLMVCAIGLVLATRSSGAIVALGLVLLVFLLAFGASRAASFARSIVILAIATGAASMASTGALVESARGKVDDFLLGEGVRALIYAELAADIVEEPLGIGKGRFVETNSFSWLGEGVYPHQNFLGIGAELGLPALAVFLAFVGVTLVRLARAAFDRSGRTTSGLRLLAVTVLAMFVYQQFRGLLQDTWVIREMYFWLGLASGALAARSHAGGNRATTT